MHIIDVIVYIALALAALASAVLKKLTNIAAMTGLIVAVLIYTGGGLTGVIALAAFFIIGSGATAVGLSNKKALGIAEENKGRRTPAQVLANGGVGALLGLFYLIHNDTQLPVRLLICGSLAAATADTLSSELGNVYGKRFYNIITLKKDTRGLDGVISLEGTLAGVFGAAVIALVYFCGTYDLLSATFVLFAGTFGTLIDSVLGATLERRGWLTNNWVNFLNTLTGAITAGLLFMSFK